MLSLSPRALAALICACIYAVQYVYASASTITSTVTSSLYVTTSTTTITLGDSTVVGTTEIPVTTIPPATSTTGMASGGNAGSGNGVYSGNQFQDAVLNSTNFFRKAYQAEPVTWNDTLAQYAQNYAKECKWEHSMGDYGENLALNYETPTAAVDSWASEEKDYDYSDAEFSKKTGHFTQLVWQNTRQVGCGAVNCDSSSAEGWLLVCEYYPPGNVVGAFKQNVEKAGSDDGNLGMGEGNVAARMGAASRWLMALVGVSSLAAVCL